MTREKLKQKLLNSGEKYECKLCKINNWLGKNLSLHLDHIDGNNSNNDLKNLRFLCPNCHSQTDTYCGKNNKIKYNKKLKKVPDKILLESMKINDNPKQALEAVGLSGAANYNRIYSLAKSNNITKMLSQKDKNILKVCELKNSNINFQVHGWVEQASKIINISPQKTRNWISKNCPELLENAYLRKSMGV